MSQASSVSGQFSSLRHSRNISTSVGAKHLDQVERIREADSLRQRIERAKPAGQDQEVQELSARLRSLNRDYEKQSKVVDQLSETRQRHSPTPDLAGAQRNLGQHSEVSERFQTADRNKVDLWV